jgi:hypothetical protein
MERILTYSKHSSGSSLRFHRISHIEAASRFCATACDWEEFTAFFTRIDVDIWRSVQNMISSVSGWSKQTVEISEAGASRLLRDHQQQNQHQQHREASGSISLLAPSFLLVVRLACKSHTLPTYLHIPPPQQRQAEDPLTS